MAIGDTFGQLDANQRGWRQQYEAEAQRPISNYFQQQSLDENARSRDQQNALALAQMQDQRAARQAQIDDADQRAADEAARYNLTYLTQRGDAAQAAAAQADQSGLSHSYFDLAKAKQDQMTADKLDNVINTGTALAQDYGQAHDAFSEAADNLKNIEDQNTNLQKAAQAIGLVNKHGLYVAEGLKATDPFTVQHAAKYNAMTKDLQNQLLQAKQAFADSQYNIKRIGNNSMRSGYVPDLSNLALIHARTGQRFQFGTPQLSDQDVTDMGYFAGGSATAPSLGPVRAAPAMNPEPFFMPAPGAPANTSYFGRAPVSAVSPEEQQRQTQLLMDAKNAILIYGKDPEMIKQRLQTMGVDPARLGI